LSRILDDPVSFGVPPSARVRPAVRWIVSRRYDLTFFVGSCVFTFLFFGLYRAAHHLGFILRGDSILITYFVFTALFDHPHIFQTFSRTHYDRTEYHKRRRLYTWGLGGFILAGYLTLLLKWEAYLIVGAAVYGTWHIIRQHYGFLKIYKGLNNDREPLDNWLDGLTYFTGMLACFFYDYGDLNGPLVIYGDLKVNSPSVPGAWGEMGWLLFLGLLTALGVRQVVRLMAGKAINVPKLLLMAAALSTHYFVFFATATPFLVAEALETVYHDIQYQGWVMNYQRRRFAEVKGVVGKWLGLAMLYGLAVGVVEIYGLMDRGWAMWLFVPFTMIVLFHYFVDGLIWRTRDDPALKQLLETAPNRLETMQ
jgi:hypothetical protein